MISRWRPREPRPARPLLNRAIALGAVIVLGIGAVAWTVLLWRYGGADPGVELDAIRTAGTLIVGAGGAAALLLAARRQRSTELTLQHQRETLEHQREVAQAAERDAAEQRITELYTRAIDQLGNSQAPVRLGGLHALERLARACSYLRQTIVDVICAYLRMPYTPPDDRAPGEDAPEDAHRRYEQRRQELQVRLTAQRILTAHLNPKAMDVFWADIDLDLTGAHLHQLNLSDCHVRNAKLDGATFAGDARFHEATSAGDALFEGAEFAGYAGFDRAEFAGYAGFYGAEFAGNVGFSKAKFAGGAGFFDAEFAKFAMFDDAEFAESVSFAGAKFDSDRKAAFIPEFDGACVAPNSDHVELPRGWITRAAQPAEGEEEGWLYVVRDEASSEQPTEASDGSSDQV